VPTTAKLQLAVGQYSSPTVVYGVLTCIVPVQASHARQPKASSPRTNRESEPTHDSWNRWQVIEDDYLGAFVGSASW
jgi:hypothetical protein